MKRYVMQFHVIIYLKDNHFLARYRSIPAPRLLVLGLGLGWTISSLLENDWVEFALISHTPLLYY